VGSAMCLRVDVVVWMLLCGYCGMNAVVSCCGVDAVV